ncbi:MAG: response regulator [candidate division WOR-3 bacterium]|nr:response regulator [candidate division WOR-3 bacterium]
MRILWIDDEIELLKPYIYLLTEKGYNITTASNGPDGLALAQKTNYDVVFLDEMMVGMDGLTVLEKLKSYDPNIIVIMITKISEEELMNRAFSQLADDYIIKPFTPNQILAVLKRIYEKKILVSEKIKRDFSQLQLKRRDIVDFRDWVKYYLTLLYWQTNIERFGDNTLRESFAQEKFESNKEFVRYIEKNYSRWIKENSGPILSNKFFVNFILPHLKNQKVYLFLFDSMTVAQWLALVPILREYYDITTQYYFSILPTATPYSRNAIFSGMLPLEIYKNYPQYWVFEESGQNRFEEELLKIQLAKLGFFNKILFVKISRTDDLASIENVLLNNECFLSIIIINFLDLLIHSIRTQRLLDEIVNSEQTLIHLTKIWFTNSEIFNLLAKLRKENNLIIITSDHGFIKVGHPTVIYGGREISSNLRYKYGNALRVDEKAAFLVERPEDLMLPVERRGIKFAIAKMDYYFIYPTKFHEYEATYKYSYQHGGISLEEMILPVAFLTPRIRLV